jgi:nitrate/nitrite-specific signal transduction histidine kinase
MRGSISLSFRLLSIIGVLALLIAITAVSTYSITRLQEEDSQVINVAGCQRMLTQRFAILEG